ncbi:aminotransferase class I/II-fold pyridoxal phosphate-dependent enzyme [Jeotgalibaca ciconiae]|uniref:Aminotransferase n=1 Tax=Jeotgalibaca ciconiae TaxID=2496265 RepID=A0A3Q9BJL8_9LACT|nr:aminotransferase class I/II-fold pyridoxal phosphate-dependent enzyme [Jeotgalibaca ciconiae]AZP03896.1 aminotransferase class I/II-fold pyridoxal phosphate-dependent enzyme [Jeotgalibaca ciconiae]HJB23842.1 aminotransferase class I/II-fold pyridoxal phosphate-dependent enzyme [Candidatus Jeotgalibaca pullicola]
MRNPLNKKVQAIAPSGIRRFFEIANEIPGVISLGVGEPDFDTPWIIRDEGMYTLQKGHTFYTANAGLLELREEIGYYLNRRYQLSYDPKEEILVTVGGSEAIDLALRAMLDPGDEVIIAEPCYVSYLPCVVLADGVPVTIQLKEENEFRLQAEELEAVITEKTKVIILSYPNNPTGAIMEKEDLEAIAKVILKHDLFVISDEIYSELSYQNNHISIAAIPGMRDRTVVINGFSKSFAMTGWRLGYAAAPKLIMEQMTKIHQFAIMAAPTSSQYAGIVAIRDCDKEVAEMRESYNQRRRFLMDAVQKLNLPCFVPYGAFYIFPNISEFGLTSEEFATKLVQEEKVAVVPGSAFGESGEGYIRISYAYSIQELKEAFVRVERFIKCLREEYKK